MSHVFFISLLILISIIRIPLSLLVIILRPLVPFFKKRLDFERKNLIDDAALALFKADYCFEVSSEGELEQVRPLMEDSLRRHKKIEIIYSSPSVEVKCQKIYETYKEQVRLLRMPLLSSAPISFLYFQSVWSWVSAPVVVFCRYDFFPELLLLKLFNKKFILVSGAFKKMSWIKEESFKFFDVVIAATEVEKENFTKLLPDRKIYACDFRVPRIAERLKNAEETLAKRTSLTRYLDKIKQTAVNEKIIIGSAWNSDLAILNHPKLVSDIKSGKMNLLILPHKLDKNFVLEIEAFCKDLFGSDLVEVVTETENYKEAPVVILQMSGILCELYSLFKASYVGGGYERSIHSVLEPFFSNAMVVTGPKITRSTEYDLVSEILPSEIHVLNNPESFYTIIESSDLAQLNVEARKTYREGAALEMKRIIEDVLP